MTRASILRLHDALLREYGNLGWWPADDPFEIAVGAVLTQNTSWRNVERAIARLKKEGNLCPSRILELDASELESLVRPSGYFRQKARYLKELARYVERELNGDISLMSSKPMDKVRTDLLALRGIGPETADSIMLYALHMPSFVVDAYTLRLLRRMGIRHERSYGAVKTAFEEALEGDVSTLANAHAMIVIHCKTVCRAEPVCGICPLANTCSEAKEKKEGVANQRS
jgi:endonuclease-3 related protein